MLQGGIFCQFCLEKTLFVIDSGFEYSKNERVPCKGMYLSTPQYGQRLSEVALKFLCPYDLTILFS